ncbi:rab effector MyRIP [Dipodomys spectabilis]|uniref:rab effector MyRIP n=1 Tax=Dipodomys spectabilis TaxID=105255 RepID=UPI001C54AE69|nr:rab effector MyRIP [Dipodomys spectabilis]
MGRKLDLSALTDDETEHVLQVVQRDFNLRKKEEERLSEMKRRLAEEGSRCSILAKHPQFVAQCCMRCCTPFTFLLNPRRRCGDCKFNVCRACSFYHKRDRAWLCGVCQQARLLRAQSLEWFYNNVKSRFKRFGSAKVLKNLYRKHRLETGPCADLLGGSFIESSLENEGSLSGSDSTFYPQSEGPGLMDTLAVALRVAGEAVEEAICRADAHGDSLEQQDEARYLREHRDELTEELAGAIVHKIIRRQRSRSPEASRPARPRQAPAAAALGRSRSELALAGAGEAALRAGPGWRSVDGLPGAGRAAPALHSPDGNWAAVAGGTLPPTRGLAAPRAGALRALAAACSAPSAYDGVASDSEDDPDWSHTPSKLHPTSPSRGRPPHPGATGSDSETSSAGSSREAGRRARLSWLQRRAPQNPATDTARPWGGLDENSNPQAPRGETSDSSEQEDALRPADRRAKRWRRAWGPSAQEPDGAAARDPHAHAASGDFAETNCPHVLAKERRSSGRPELGGKMSEEEEEETSSGEEPGCGPQGESGSRGEGAASDSNGGTRHAPHELKKNGRAESGVSSELQLLSAVLEQKCSAVSLCNISTEVLKLINAAEALLDEPTGPTPRPPDTAQGALPRGADCDSLDRQLTALEGNVYLAAGTVYSLEGQLSELEDAARGIHSHTNEAELAELEDQAATAAARVHHAELQISDIESRISALTIAGLNIAPCGRLTRKREQKQSNPVQTIDTSRQLRRKLPAPPLKAEKLEASSMTDIKTFNRNFVLQGCCPSNRPAERKITTQDSGEPAVESAATQ